MRDAVLLRASETKQVDAVRMESRVVVVPGGHRHRFQGGSQRGARERDREPAKTNVVGKSARPPTDALTEGTDEKSKLRDSRENWKLLAHVERPSNRRMSCWRGSACDGES
jgi:hypothetical protein